MAVHRISLATALLLVIVAIILLEVVGVLGLLLLLLAGLLFWYSVGPGRRGPVTITLP